MDDDKARLTAAEHAIEEIRKAVFEENLTVANLKRRIARIIREYQHGKGESP